MMRAHIVTVIDSRTRCPAPMMIGNLNEEASNRDANCDEFVGNEDGELYRLEKTSGKTVFTKPRHHASKGNTKGGGKGKADKECFLCGRICHIRADCKAKAHVNGGPPKFAPEIVRKKSKTYFKNVPLGIIDFGSFEVLSDHGDTVEDDVQVDESSEEATGIMPPLPPASCFKKTGTSKHTEMHCGKFSKHCRGNNCRKSEESPFFDCWDWKHEQSDVLQQVDPWARNAPKSVPSVKSCFSVNFPVCSVCRKLGVYQDLPIKASQYDISIEGEGPPDEVPIEVGPSDTPMMESGGLMRGGPEHSHDRQHVHRQ